MEGKKANPTYTTILHEARKKLGITLLEYCLGDSIHKLSSKPDFPWCRASKNELADFLGVSRRTITDLIKKLLDKGLIEKDSQTKFLRSTLRWISAVELNERAKSAHSEKKLPIGEQKVPTPREETSHNNNNNNNTNNTSNEGNPVAIVRTHFIERCKELHKIEPRMAFGKEGKLLKDFFKKFSTEQGVDLVNKYLNSEIGEKLGWTLSICLSAPVINQWLAGKLEKPKKPYFNGYPMRKYFGKWQVLENGNWLEFAGRESEIIFK